MATITTLNPNDTGATSRGVINTNFTNLNTDKAELASPTFTGTPSLPTGTTGVTQAANDNSTKLATTAYVATAVSGTSKARVRAYKSAGNQTISTPLTKVTFESESYDVNSNFASSTFTAPRTGYYQITASSDGTSGSSTARGITIAIYKNGTVYSSLSNAMTANSAAPTGINISDTLSLAASDTIEIYLVVNADNVTLLSGERYTFITINEL